MNSIGIEIDSPQDVAILLEAKAGDVFEMGQEVAFELEDDSEAVVWMETAAILRNATRLIQAAMKMHEYRRRMA